MPKQPPSLITETQVRTFLRCPRLKSLGGVAPLLDQPQTLLFQECLGSLIWEWMQHLDRPPLEHVAGTVTRVLLSRYRQFGYRRDELDVLAGRLNLALGEVLVKFPPAKYLPISGPFQYQIQVDGVALQVQVIGVIRALENHCYHWLTCTPYPERHSVLSDPISHLKVEEFLKISKGMSGNPSVSAPEAMICHFLYMGPFTGQTTLLHHWLPGTELRQDNVMTAKQVMANIGAGYNQPTLPCPWAQCPFKEPCMGQVQQVKGYVNVHATEQQRRRGQPTAGGSWSSPRWARNKSSR